MPEKRIAIYIRLSNADEEKGRSRDESNSVVNQRGLIHHFLDNHAELVDYPRAEFVDDGFSGTNTDRPAFQRMVKAIREGDFCCCITKDFSRFARDYIEMGDYLECLFPFLGVRYISVNDGYDSNEYLGTTGGLDVVMRAIVYDAYSKDLSLKVKTGHLQSMKKGRRVRGDPGYGYLRDPKRKGMDILDPEAAAIVRRIFNAAIAGKTVSEIARVLNSEKIPTPGVYFRQKHPDSRKYTDSSTKQSWTHGAVTAILRRYAYTGAFVGGLREQVAPCHKSLVRKKAEEWIIVPGMHEAIITPEEYALAQKVISDRQYKGTGKPKAYPLKSLLVCGNCLRHMEWSRRTSMFRCKYHDLGGDEACRDIHTPKEEDMEDIVFHAIQNFIQLADEHHTRKKQRIREMRKAVASNQADIKTMKERIETLKERKFRAYEQYSLDMSSKEQYLLKKQEIDAEIAAIEVELLSGSQRDEQYLTEARSICSEVEAMCETFRNEKCLTYDMAHAFVDRILVYPDERIELQWRFSDCLDGR